jgi:hypothetical protein
LNDFPEEVQELLDNFADIVVDELPNSLPPIRSISHHINLIPGESLQNKATYRLTSRENEEVKNQVQELLDKGLVREILSPCAVPTVLSPKKDGRMENVHRLKSHQTRSPSGIDSLYREWMI